MTPEPQPVQEENEDFGFISLDSIYEKEKEQQPSIFQKGLRTTARAMQRSAETLGGLPGDIVQSVRGLAEMLPGGIKPEEDLNFLQKGARRLVEGLPSSAELRARSAEVRPELEPESEAEEIQDEVISDFASLAIPVKGKIPFARAIGLSAIGNLGKQGVKELGGGEGAQEATKLGLMVFSGMFGKGRGVNNYINKLYDKGRSLVPKGAKFTYNTGKLDKVEKILRTGSLTEDKASVLKIIEDIKAKSPNSVMDVVEGVQFDKDINKAIRKAAGNKEKKGYLKLLKSANESSLGNYAKENPSWGEIQKEAKQAYAGIAQSENIQDYIKKNINLKNISHAGIILGLEESAIPGRPVEKIIGTALTGATLYSAEIAKRLAKNPALRKYYENVVKASLSENKAMLARNLNGLERVAKKEFEENPFPKFNLEEEEQ